MAGGQGERFWPLSTQNAPKPFLKVLGDKTMIQLTVERVRRIIPPERIFVALGKNHTDIARRQLSEMGEQNLIVEPEGRDTAPCIGLAALTLLRLDSEAIMVVLPADHYVPDTDDFVRTVDKGVQCAQAGDYLVTIGIRPTRPETGYGYIHACERFAASEEVVCYKSDTFVEKPDLERAEKYIEDGNYYWNAGMFIWKALSLMRAIEEHMPELYKALLVMQDALAAGDRRKVEATYLGITRESIDYGLMEKARNVLMVPAQFQWDDIGTWSSLLRVLALDEGGNHLKGHSICIDTQNSIVFGDDVVIGTIGVSNLAIIASKQGVLVCDIHRAQEVREIVKKLGRDK